MPREKVLSVTANDLVWQYKRGTGNGGQKRNKTNSAVRVVHPPSGAVGEAQDARGQLANRKLALRRLANSVRFRQWVQLGHAEIQRGETVDQEVARAMGAENIKVEVRKNGQWTEESSDPDLAGTKHEA